MTNPSPEARRARRRLVQTVSDTLQSQSELGNVAQVTNRKLGRISILRGLTPPGTINDHLPVSVTLLERRYLEAGRIASIVLRGALFDQYQVVLEPYEINLFELKKFPPQDSIQRDETWTYRVEVGQYSRQESVRAVDEFMSHPYGLKGDEHLEYIKGLRGEG
jgi:hypothetical protein